MSPSRIVVVGASIGGLTVAETLREEGFDGSIVLVGDEEHLPYTRPPLSKQILLGHWEPDQAAIRSASEIDARDIEVLTGCSASGLDVGARVLHTSRGPLPFDELVIATGTRPRPHPDAPWAPTLRTMDDALRLRDALGAARRVAVLGSGILGSEMASAARAHDAETVLIGRSGTLGFGGVGTLLTDRLGRLHHDNAVDLRLTARIAVARPSERGAGRGGELTFAAGDAERFDLVVAMIGGTPATAWLDSSDLALADGILADETGRAAPGVWAVGDVAAWADPVSGRHVRVEHQSNAIEQALAVAARLVHGTDSPAPVPLFWSEIHRTRIHAYGWFDPATALDETPAATGAVLRSVDADGFVRGVVGWNAAPRDFRAARASVLAAVPSSERQSTHAASR